MRITEKVREEAAVICSVCACYGEPLSVTRATSLLYSVPETVAVRSPVARLAVRAWDAASRRLVRQDGYDASTLRDEYAEAEALLRTGWTP